MTSTPSVRPTGRSTRGPRPSRLGSTPPATRPSSRQAQLPVRPAPAPTSNPTPSIRGAAPFSATLCGALTVVAGDRSLGAADLGGTKPRQILVALMLSPGQPVSKAELAERVWGHEPDACGIRTLETYVSLLRKRLHGLHPALADGIRTAPGGYLLDPSVIEVDTYRFRSLCRAARAPGLARAAVVSSFAAALAAVDGPLLAQERNLDWIEAERRAHEDAVTAALVEAAAAATVVGDLEVAERWSRRAVDRDPLHEGAWAGLLESLERLGRHADGIRAYHVCRRLFAEELGCAPGPGIRQIFGRLLEGTDGGGEAGLSALVDAVVRLHTELAAAGGRTVSARPPVPVATVPGVAEACALLDRLLRSAMSGSRRAPLPA